jgi:hypothetical protein
MATKTAPDYVAPAAGDGRLAGPDGFAMQRLQSPQRRSPMIFIWLAILIAFELVGAYVAASCHLSVAC